MKIEIRRVVALVVIVASATLITWPFVFGWHRPYINWSPWDLAEYLVDHERPASECFDLLYMEIMSPSQVEQRAHCVYEYAKLQKDPSACEKLMPSSYGLSCVGAAESTSDACWFMDGKVHWDGGNAAYGTCKADDPKRAIKGNECCLMTRIALVLSENDCSPLLYNTDLHDECLALLAFKNRDPETCDGIQNENRRIACDVRAKAMKEDPSICNGCKQPVPALSDLR